MDLTGSTTGYLAMMLSGGPMSELRFRCHHSPMQRARSIPQPGCSATSSVLLPCSDPDHLLAEQGVRGAKSGHSKRW